MTAFTPSILGVGSLEKAISWTPLGFGCVCEGNLPFSYTCCWLVSMEIEYCRLSKNFEQFRPGTHLISCLKCSLWYQFSDLLGHSLLYAPLQNYLPLFSSSVLLAQLVMLIVVVVPKMKNHTVAMQQGVHTVEALVSRRDFGDFSS